MNAAETQRLCRIIAGLAPAQLFDAETPAIWHAVLADLAFADALEAVKQLARRQPFIGTCDIVQEVTQMRTARLRTAPPESELMAGVDPADAAGWVAEKRRRLTLIADGAQVHELRRLTAGPDTGGAA